MANSLAWMASSVIGWTHTLDNTLASHAETWAIVLNTDQMDMVLASMLEARRRSAGDVLPLHDVITALQAS